MLDVPLLAVWSCRLVRDGRGNVIYAYDDRLASYLNRDVTAPCKHRLPASAPGGAFTHYRQYYAYDRRSQLPSLTNTHIRRRTARPHVCARRAQQDIRQRRSDPPTKTPAPYGYDCSRPIGLARELNLHGRGAERSRLGAATAALHCYDASGGRFVAPDSAPGAGFANGKGLKDCSAVALREVLLGATGRDPGDVKSEMAIANGTPNHDWRQKGMWPGLLNQGPVALAHGAKIVPVFYATRRELIAQIGTVPVSVSVNWTTVDAPHSPIPGAHQVTIRSNPEAGNYIVTNAKEAGGEVFVTGDQLRGSFPIGRTDCMMRIWMPAEVDGIAGVGYTAVPLPAGP